MLLVLHALTAAPRREPPAAPHTPAHPPSLLWPLWPRLSLSLGRCQVSVQVVQQAVAVVEQRFQRVHARRGRGALAKDARARLALVIYGIQLVLLGGRASQPANKPAREGMADRACRGGLMRQVRPLLR